jgi:hypothetical protein
MLSSTTPPKMDTNCTTLSLTPTATGRTDPAEYDQETLLSVKPRTCEESKAFGIVRTVGGA